MPAFALLPCWLTQVAPAAVQAAVLQVAVLQTQRTSCAAYRVALAVLAAWPACWAAWVVWAVAWVLAARMAWPR